MTKKIGAFEYSGKDDGDKRYLTFDFGLIDERGRSVGAVAYIKNIADPGEQPKFKIWTSPARDGQGFGRAKTLNLCASMKEAETEVAQSLNELSKRAQVKYSR